MVNRNKVKGIYHEKQVEQWLNEMGIPAKRQPLSGALGGEWAGDLIVTVGLHRLVTEVKYRDGSRFPSPFTVLEDRDMAIFKKKTGRQTSETIVIMSDEVFLKILGKDQQWRRQPKPKDQ
jgi:hypothetical protein